MGILNITRGVLSSNENYLLVGANCNENSKPVERFLNHLAREIDTVENKTYVLTHNGQVLYKTIGDLVSKETVCCVGGKVKH